MYGSQTLRLNRRLWISSQSLLCRTGFIVAGSAGGVAAAAAATIPALVAAVDDTVAVVR